MSGPSHLGAVLYEAEDTFGENEAMDSPVRLNIHNEVDVSGLTWEKQDLNPTRTYRNEGWHHVRGEMGGSFSIRVPLTGHGTATTGSLTATALTTLLGYVIGNSEAAASGTTVDDATASATEFDVTSASGWLVGHLGRLGELGDGAAEGQAFVLGGIASSTFTAETALPAAPANSDVLYAMQTVYPHESSAAGTEVTGLRFLLQTDDLQFLCHGCYATGITISGLNAGELPMVEITFGVAWWEPVSETFPAASTLQTYAPPCIDAGSFAYNVAGTATRQTLSIRDFSLNINIDTVPLRGPGGAHTHQSIIGCRRRSVSATISFTVDSESPTTTPVWYSKYDDNENSANYHWFLYTASVVDGSALAFFMPACVMTSPAPTQAAQDGLQRVSTSWQCQTNTDTSTATTDLWLSSFRIAMG